MIILRPTAWGSLGLDFRAQATPPYIYNSESDVLVESDVEGPKRNSEIYRVSENVEKVHVQV